MATSGSIVTGTCEGRSLTMSWSLSSQSVAGNYSNVSWSLTGSGSAGGYVKSGNFTAVINGTTVYSSSTRIELRNGTVVASGSIQIPHNSDGTKTFSMSCQAGIYYVAVNCSASGSFALTTIPRASSVSIGSATMEQSTTITISRASSSFTHTLTYAFGNVTGTIVSNTASTSVSWTPPISLAYQVPNATVGTGSITCYTYSGGTHIGTKSCTLTLTVPSSIKPTIGSLSVDRIDGDVPDDWEMYVETKSKATVSILDAAGSYGSTISSWQITGGGYTGTSNTLTTGFLNTNGEVVFTARVTDSRGRTSDEKTITITVVPYSVPTFSNYTSQRCTSDGELSDEGSYVKGVTQYAYSSCEGMNWVMPEVYYKKTTDTEWVKGNVYYDSGDEFIFGSGDISSVYTYDVMYELVDAFSTIQVFDIVSTADVVMDFKAGGKGVAVGKVSETENTFEVSDKWDVKIYGKLMKDYLIDTIYPIGSIYMSVNSSNPASHMGGTWIAWGSGRVPVGVDTGQGEFNTVEKTGGAKTHTLSVGEMPSHGHSYVFNIQHSDGTVVSSSEALTSGLTVGGRRRYTDSTYGAGGGGSHNNLQPYITCYMWKRTA